MDVGVCLAAEAYWALAQSEPTVQGFNAWHWSDRPGMDPTSGFARGVVSLGPELLQCKCRNHRRRSSRLLLRNY